MPNQGRPFLFVVAEAGSRWPHWLTQYQRALSDVTVVASEADGTPAELALRATRRLASLESQDRRVTLAVILAGAQSSADEVFESRCLLARALLRHMSSSKRGKLVFAGGEGLNPDATQELMSLVGTLTNQLAGTRLSISVRFERAADSSPDHDRASAGMIEVA
jgi:hypothetical protein